MSKRFMIAIGVLLTVAVLGGVGIGYSQYQGGTYSEDNTVDVVKNHVDIWAYNGSEYVPLETPIVMPEYKEGEEVTTDTYRLVLSGSGSIYLMCQMKSIQGGDSQMKSPWPLIRSMSLRIDGQNYAFGVMNVNGKMTTGVPTDPISLTGGQTFTSNGETLVYYDFTITIEFSNIDIQQDPDWERLSSFEGSKFEFVFIPQPTDA